MKGLTWIQKILFLVNVFFAILLLVGYVLPYMPPHFFPKLSVLSLILPVLLLVNIVFFVFWLIKLKRALWLSGFIILIGFGHLKGLYTINSKKTIPVDVLRVMTYNTHLFGRYHVAGTADFGSEIIDFITAKNPDVVCLQEYRKTYDLDKKKYPFRYQKMRSAKGGFGQKIYSKYPIVGQGSLDFKSSYNNGIYADVVKGQDTVRVYNMHFESLRLASDMEALQSEASEKLLNRMAATFKKQEMQCDQFLAHEEQSPYPVIVVGDFNNRSSSYLYRKVKGIKNDAFIEAGSGIGTTFNFDFLPIRIDFVLADPVYKPVDFKNFKLDYSDHHPIMATFSK